MDNSKIVAIFLLTKDGIILSTNKGVLNEFGFHEEDIKGQYFSVLFTKDDRQKKLPEVELKEVKERGSSEDTNYLVHKDGSWLWSKGESILTEDEEGKPFIVKIVYNLHKQKELEEALLKSNNDLNTFVYTASHDLKAPINNIQGLLEILESQIENNEDSQATIAMMKESAKGFQNVLSDLSEQGKVQHYQHSEGNESTAIEDIFEGVVENLSPLIESFSAKVRHDFSEVNNLDISRKNLRSLLHNLLSNSIKYHAQGRNPEVFVSTKEVKPNYALLIVRDNGRGINQEDIDKMFGMYQRLPSEELIEGSGVGLSLVKQIVDNNGGKIEVKSEPGVGTTVYLYLKNHKG
ncbi:MAG: sensor histidine kinase [Cytophagaceae bacterium]